MPIAQRPSLSKLLVQTELNKFYEKPVAQVSLGLALSLISIIFFALVAIKPTLETMSDLLKEIAQKQTIDTQLSAKIIALSTAQSQLTAKSQQAQLLYQAVPATPDFVRLITMVEKLASEHNVEYLSFLANKTPLERSTVGIQTSPSATLESIPFVLTFQGQYSDLLSVASDLQSLQRIIVIDRIDIIPPTDTANATSVTAASPLLMSLSVRAFTFKGTATLSKTTIGQ